MGGELLTSPKGGEQSPPVNYTEVFYKELPYYLAIGMPLSEYWNGDCTLTKVYHEAHKIKQEEKNQELWLQGLYIYEALLCSSPVFHDFVKKPKPLPYPEKPYELRKKEEPKEVKEQKNMMDIMDKVKEWRNRIIANKGENNG